MPHLLTHSYACMYANNGHASKYDPLSVGNELVWREVVSEPTRCSSFIHHTVVLPCGLQQVPSMSNILHMCHFTLNYFVSVLLIIILWNILTPNIYYSVCITGCCVSVERLSQLKPTSLVLAVEKNKACHIHK